MFLLKLMVLCSFLHSRSFATLLPWNPGYALALNSRTNTEYAYSYPRRMYRTFTVEMWMRGSTTSNTGRVPFSVAHPNNDNAVLISDQIYVLGVLIMPGPTCQAWAWCHVSLSVDLSSYPAYDIRLYVDGQFVMNSTAKFNTGLSAAALEQETLSIVFGQEQDSQLGGFDSSQIFSGHVDDVRIWNTIRTPQEILNNKNAILTAPYPSSLVSYYTFDDSVWDATFYEDKANTSTQHRLYVVDYTNATAAPIAPPSYTPAAAPLAGLALSSAPLCSAPGSGWLAMRAMPGSSLTVPVAALYCGATTPTVSATVTAVRGGTAGSLNAPLDNVHTITFVVDAGGIISGAGFNYTVADGSNSVTGFVGVLSNNAPALASQMALYGDEDTVVISWVQAMDPDRDIVTVEVEAAPAAGAVHMDGFVNRTLRYSPPPNANGIAVGQFALRARDSWGAASIRTLNVSISLRPVADAPVLQIKSNFSLYRGQRIAIPFSVVGVDGKDPFVIVSDWPTSAQGFLEAQEGGRNWTINQFSVSSKLQWASGYGNYSSMYAAQPYDMYGIGQIVGTPTTAEYGDSVNAWCPATIDGGCVNLADPKESLSTFHTEFFEATFSTPMYLSNVVLVQNYGGNRVSRILVPSDRNPTKWKTVMTRDLVNSPASLDVTKYSVESPDICQVLWPVDRIRVEVDTCHRSGWYEVDAVQIRGGIRASQNVLNTTTQLFFRAAEDFTGNIVFGLTATQCYGSFIDTSTPLSISVEVKDTPFVLSPSVQSGWFAIDVGQLHSGPRVGNVQVLQLPAYGSLRFGGRVLQHTLEDLGSPATMFEYNAYRCDAAMVDTFLVQLGPTAVVQVNVQGCTTVVSMLIAIVVPCVAGPFTLMLLGSLWWRHRRGQRDNSKAPRDPNRDICVLFTDIQASTMLWGEVPGTMSTALDTHHAIIRQLIKKYRCYEVKTIGDSFMVACGSPSAALHLALAIQEALHQHNWEGDDLDEVYRRQTDCHLPPHAYARLWRGLRVRIGLHYGRAQITFDQTTKGYDYYGTVVNAAARIEGAAHGGQIVMSRQVYELVADHCAYRVSSKPLGPTQLRGLPVPLDLVQVLPTCFAEREFPPLRLDHGGEEDEEEVEDTVSDAKEVRNSLCGSVMGRPLHQYPQALDREALVHPMVRSGTISEEAAVSLAYNVFYTLKSQVNMCKKPEERKKKLRELCKQWHVPCKVGTERQENNSLGKLALQLMGSVANQMHGTSWGRCNSSYVTEDTSARQALNRIVPTSRDSHILSLTTETKRLSLCVDDC